MVSRLTVVFLTFLAVIPLTASRSPRPRFRFRSRSNPALTCPKVYGKSCTTDKECRCDRLICNYKGQCYKISVTDIVLRQPCPEMFKKQCSSNDDCNKSSNISCKQLVCDVDHECVYQKNTVN